MSINSTKREAPPCPALTFPDDHASSSTKFDGRAFRRCPYKGASLRKQEEVSISYIRTFSDPSYFTPRVPTRVPPHFTFSKSLLSPCCFVLSYFNYIADHLSLILSGGNHKVSLYLLFLSCQYRPLSSRLRCVQSS